MKKHDVSKLALMGLMGGLLVTAQAAADEKDDNKGGNFIASSCGGGSRSHSCAGGSSSRAKGQNNQQYDKPQAYAEDDYQRRSIADHDADHRDAPNDKFNANKPAGKQWTEAELRNKLAKEHRDWFDKLDAEGKKHVLQLVNRDGVSPEEAVKIAAKKNDKKSASSTPSSSKGW